MPSLHTRFYGFESVTHMLAIFEISVRALYLMKGELLKKLWHPLLFLDIYSKLNIYMIKTKYTLETKLKKIKIELRIKCRRIMYMLLR